MWKRKEGRGRWGLDVRGGAAAGTQSHTQPAQQNIRPSGRQGGLLSIWRLCARAHGCDHPPSGPDAYTCREPSCKQWPNTSAGTALTRQCQRRPSRTPGVLAIELICTVLRWALAAIGLAILAFAPGCLPVPPTGKRCCAKVLLMIPGATLPCRLAALPPAWLVGESTPRPAPALPSPPSWLASSSLLLSNVTQDAEWASGCSSSAALLESRKFCLTLRRAAPFRAVLFPSPVLVSSLILDEYPPSEVEGFTMSSKAEFSSRSSMIRRVSESWRSSQAWLRPPCTSFFFWEGD